MPRVQSFVSRACHPVSVNSPVLCVPPIIGTPGASASNAAATSALLWSFVHITTSSDRRSLPSVAVTCPNASRTARSALLSWLIPVAMANPDSFGAVSGDFPAALLLLPAPVVASGGREVPFRGGGGWWNWIATICG